MLIFKIFFHNMYRNGISKVISVKDGEGLTSRKKKTKKNRIHGQNAV